ncbi:response regulator [Luteitalea sp.]|uniref:response regulator n=1 Tax=Luteitalea sp. TaxID=2004800 RepID=UPI00345B4555
MLLGPPPPTQHTCVSMRIMARLRERTQTMVKDRALGQHTPGAASSGLPVLVVGSEPDVAAMTARLLTSQGFRPAISPTALDALRHARRSTFAVAIVDIALGGELDGIDVAEWMSGLYGVSIVLAAETVDEQTLRRASRLDPSSFLVKPIQPPSCMPPSCSPPCSGWQR